MEKDDRKALGHGVWYESKVSTHSPPENTRDKANEMEAKPGSLKDGIAFSKPIDSEGEIYGW